MASQSALPVSPGLRVCSFESRRGDEMRSLIERQGGVPTIAPSLREIPLEQNPAAFEFGKRLLDGKIDIMIFLTGVGARGLMDVLETAHPREDILAAWDKTINIVRGPKPNAVLREWKVRVDHQVREPNTFHELLELLDEKVPVLGQHVALQEYGQANPELNAGLLLRGAILLEVPVYRWALPQDTEPLKQAVQQVVAGEFDVLLWTSAFQLNNVLTVADECGGRDAFLQAAQRCFIGSIGPTASANLSEHGLPPNCEASHPKMGHLVRDTLAAATEKRGR